MCGLQSRLIITLAHSSRFAKMGIPPSPERKSGGGMWAARPNKRPTISFFPGKKKKNWDNRGAIVRQSNRMGGNITEWGWQLYWLYIPCIY
jgi:hypothetical protein